LSSNLNELYASHCLLKQKPEAFIPVLAKTVYEQPRYFGFRDADEVGEAFACYWTRILGVIERYQDTGSCFDAYVATTLRYIAMSIRRQYLRRQASERVLCQNSGYDLDFSTAADTLCLNRRLYAGQELRLPLQRGNRKVFSQRLLFLSLKSAAYINDSDMECIARRIGYSTETVLVQARAARQLLAKKQERRNQRLQTRNSIWVRLQLYRSQLRHESGVEQRQSLKARLVRLEDRYQLLLKELQTRRVVLSNREIAGLCAVSKAVVDSGLDRLRQSYPDLTAPPGTV